MKFTDLLNNSMEELIHSIVKEEIAKIKTVTPPPAQQPVTPPPPAQQPATPPPAQPVTPPPPPAQTVTPPPPAQKSVTPPPAQNLAITITDEFLGEILGEFCNNGFYDQLQGIFSPYESQGKDSVYALDQTERCSFVTQLKSIPHQPCLDKIQALGL